MTELQDLKVGDELTDINGNKKSIINIVIDTKTVQITSIRIFRGINLEIIVLISGILRTFGDIGINRLIVRWFPQFIKSEK